MLKLIASTIMLLLLSACAEVGSERWCKNMEDKPKGEWTANEASEYASNCVFRSDED